MLSLVIIFLISVTVLFVVMSNVKYLPFGYVLISCTIIVLIFLALHYQQKFIISITVVLYVVFGIMFCLLMEILYNYFKKNKRMV